MKKQRAGIAPLAVQVIEHAELFGNAVLCNPSLKVTYRKEFHGKDRVQRFEIGGVVYTRDQALEVVTEYFSNLGRKR